MNYDCDVVRDLLPLYQDGAASKKSREVVDEHLAQCADCRDFAQKLPHDLAAAAAPEQVETRFYQKVAQRLRRRKALIGTALAAILCLCGLGSYAYADGVRFAARQAAQSSRYVDEKSVLLADMQVNSYRLFFYENDDKYRTILTHNILGVWKLNGNSFWANKTDDAVKLVGWCSLEDPEKGLGIMAVPVQSFDAHVAYIEMGPQDDRIKIDVAPGDLAIFSWCYSLRWNDLDGVAYDADGRPLYELGYEVNGGTIKPNELRWLPV